MPSVYKIFLKDDLALNAIIFGFNLTIRVRIPVEITILFFKIV